MSAHTTSAAMVLAAVVGLLGVACGGAGDGQTGFPEGDDRVKVATTVAPITSIVAGIVGDWAGQQCFR